MAVDSRNSRPGSVRNGAKGLRGRLGPEIVTGFVKLQSA
jgi:hypothetical protein